MFGIGKNKADADNQKAEEIEGLKKTIRAFIERIKKADPEDAARISEQAKEFCMQQQLIPFDFKKEALATLRRLECESNMRFADKFIRQAAGMVNKEQMRDKGKLIAESRRYFTKSCSLGVEPGWKRAYQRMAETLMMSGGVKLDGVSRAKPKDTAPRAPNRAKM
jgi:hypothetical protein